MRSRSVALVLAVGLCAAVAVAAPPRRLPDFSLSDPAGRVHTRASLGREGVVLVVTAPTLANEDAQRGWEEQLRKARPRASRVRLAFVEDLDQSWFPDTAVDAMREDYVPGQDPVLLLDRRGALRRALGIDDGATVVLAFDRAGLLVRTERGDPSGVAANRVWAAVAEDEAVAGAPAPRR